MIFNRKVLLAVTCSAGVFFRAAAAAEGKSTKGTKSQSNPVPLYFLNPSSCPQDCVQCFNTAQGDDDDDGGGGHGTGEAVQPCNAENKHQMWRLHQKDGLTMIESYFNPGDCLAVVPPQESDELGATVKVKVSGANLDVDMTLNFLRNEMKTLEFGDEMKLQPGAVLTGTGDGWVVDDTCQHGSVGLVSCIDPAAQWIVNGANLISALCWKNGISSFLTVNEECSELSVMAADGGNDALLRSQTFMLTEQDFIETIVPVSSDEADPNDSDGFAFGSITGGNFAATGQDKLGQVPTEIGVLFKIPLGGAAAILYPDLESGSVVPAECDPSCENGKVCAKSSPTEPGGECYTECEDDTDGRGCETAGDKCVKGLSTDGIISTDCDCEEAADGNGGYLWMCRAY